jgi:hypothetical protein
MIPTKVPTGNLGIRKKGRTPVMPYKEKAKDRASWRRMWSNSQRVKNECLERKRKYRKRNADFVNSLKSSPCVDCGQLFHPVSMDFDRLGGKDKTISRLVSRPVSIERIKREIAKCELVCSNCHRVRHLAK